MTHFDNRLLPVSDEDLESLHFELSHDLLDGILQVNDAFAQTCGEPAAHAAMRAILIHTGCLGTDAEQARFDEIGWQKYIEEERVGGTVDLLNQVSRWVEGAAYAAQGTVRLRPETSDIAEREKHVRQLIAFGEDAAGRAASLFSESSRRIWLGVKARAAIDFGGQLTPEGVVLLARITPAAVRNAINSGDLAVDSDGTISAESARDWLARRRDFCPSRWMNPADDQWAFDNEKVIKAEDGVVHVPQDGEGRLFLPENVVRRAKSGNGLSITVGMKGEERRFHDYYTALEALAEMATPRWRRCNSVGNWGIVRARGAWVPVSKVKIDRQLAEKLMETA